MAVPKPSATRRQAPCPLNPLMVARRTSEIAVATRCVCRLTGIVMMARTQSDTSNQTMTVMALFIQKLSVLVAIRNFGPEFPLYSR